MLRTQLILRLLYNLLFLLLLFLLYWLYNSRIRYLKQICGKLENLISRNRSNTKVQFSLFTVFLYVELFLCCIFQKPLINFLKIFLICFLFLWNKYLFQNLVYFLKMPHFNHSISLINNQILQVTELQYVVVQQLMKSTGCTDNYLGLMLLEDSQLFLFRYSTDNAAHGQLLFEWDVIIDGGNGKTNVSINLLCQLSRRSQYQCQYLSRK